MLMTTIYFDFETGGVRDDCPNIQLAAIAIDDTTGQELESFERKISFDPSACDVQALEINHYTAEEWKYAITPEQTIADFTRFILPYKCISLKSNRTGRPYVVAKVAGYNAATFDFPRLKRMYGTVFMPCSFFVRDVLQRAIFWFDEHPDLTPPDNFKLATVCNYFGIDAGGAHDALVDVRLTAALYSKLKQHG